jgi:signal transduction histidine kinase
MEISRNFMRISSVMGFVQFLRKHWDAVSSVGLAGSGLSGFEMKSTVFINRISTILCFFLLSSLLINLLIGATFFLPALGLALVFILMSYLLNHSGYFRLARFNTLLTILVLMSFMTYKAGFGAGLEFYFLSSTVLPFIIFRNTPTILFFQALIILSLSALKFYAPVVSAENVEYRIFYIVNSVYSALFIIAAILFYRNINKRHETMLLQNARLIGEKNTQLEALNKELDSFSYSVSHDLQAPLRAVEGFSRLLEKKYQESLDEEGKELLTRIRNATLRMRRLIDELLKLSQSGKAVLKAERVDLNEIMRMCLAEQEAVSRPGLEIRMQHLPTVEADRLLIQQVCTNLISNAIKYSSRKERPVVEIGYEKGEGEYILYVRDNGAGFEQQHADRLFKAFQRLHSTEDFEGTGVGLAIVQTIISRHGGRVWAWSVPGEGASFFFSLPMRENGPRNL